MSLEVKAARPGPGAFSQTWAVRHAVRHHPCCSQHGRPDDRALQIGCGMSAAAAAQMDVGIGHMASRQACSDGEDLDVGFLTSNHACRPHASASPQTSDAPSQHPHIEQGIVGIRLGRRKSDHHAAAGHICHLCALQMVLSPGPWVRGQSDAFAVQNAHETPAHVHADVHPACACPSLLKADVDLDEIWGFLQLLVECPAAG